MNGDVPTAQRNLLAFGVVLLLLNLVAAAIAVAVNWPSQFGGVGTDAGDELVTRGTAISAPLLPIAILAVSLLLVWRGGRMAVVGLVGVCATAALFLVGGIGELVAEGTTDTPKGVLVVSGIVWIAIAVTLLALAARAFRQRA